MKKKTRTTYAILNVFAGVVGQVAQTVFNFVNRMVFARCLAVDYLGVNDLFIKILTALSLAELGIGTAIVYELYSTLANNDDAKTKSLMRFYKRAYQVIGTVVGIIGVLLIPFLHFFWKKTPEISENVYIVYLLYLLNTVVSYFYAYKRSILVADQKTYIVSITQVSTRIIQDIIQITLLITTHNFILYLVIQVLMTVTFNIIVSRISDKQYPIINEKDIDKLSEDTKNSLVKNIKALVIRKLGGVLVNSSDSIIISKVLGVAANGFTSNYTLLTSTLNLVLTQIFTGITASIGNVNAVETKDKKIKMFYIVNFLNFWLYGWVAVSFAVVSNNVVEIAFGSRYVLGLGICIIMATNLYTYGMQSAVWAYRNTLGLFDKGKYIEMITGILNIVFSIAFGIKWGITGVFVATLLARTLTNLWYDPHSIFKYGFEQSSKTYFVRYVSMAITVIVAFGVTYVCCLPIEKISNRFIVFILKILICVFVPNLLFIIRYHSSEEYKFLKGKVLDMFFKMIKKVRK